MSERPRGYNDADLIHSIRELARWLGIGVGAAQRLAKVHRLWRVIPGTSKRVIPVQVARQCLGLDVVEQVMEDELVPIPLRNARARST